MKIVRTLAAIMAPLVVLAACVSAPPPPPVAPPPSRPAAAPPASMPAPPLAWSDRAVAPGVWRWRSDAGASTATFGEAGGAARIVMRCDPTTRRVEIAVMGEPVGPLTLRATTTAKTYSAAPGAGLMVAIVDARDPMLDALAFSRGKVMIGQVIAPSWPEIARVVEDCRG